MRKRNPDYAVTVLRALRVANTKIEKVDKNAAPDMAPTFPTSALMSGQHKGGQSCYRQGQEQFMETRQLSLRQIQPQVGPSQLMQTLNGPTRYAHLHPVILLRNRRMLAAPGKLCGQLA